MTPSSLGTLLSSALVTCLLTSGLHAQALRVAENLNDNVSLWSVGIASGVTIPLSSPGPASQWKSGQNITLIADYHVIPQASFGFVAERSAFSYSDLGVSFRGVIFNNVGGGDLTMTSLSARAKAYTDIEGSVRPYFTGDVGLIYLEYAGVNYSSDGFTLILPASISKNMNVHGGVGAEIPLGARLDFFVEAKWGFFENGAAVNHIAGITGGVSYWL